MDNIKDVQSIKDNSPWSDICDSYFDDIENFISIDAWITNSDEPDDEEGSSIARIYVTPANSCFVVYLDERAKTDDYAQEVICEAIATHQKNNLTTNVKSPINDNDLAFLIKLQHELNTQENDYNADPVFWGIIDEFEEPAYEGCGDLCIKYKDVCYTENNLNDLISLLREQAVDEFDTGSCDDDENECEEPDEDCIKSFELDNIITIYDAKDLMESYDFNIECVEYQVNDRVLTSTGAFLTKKAAKSYIENFKYNHRNPRTYAMTGYRNFELERLLKILKTADFASLLQSNITDVK